MEIERKVIRTGRNNKTLALTIPQDIIALLKLEHEDTLFFDVQRGANNEYEIIIRKNRRRP